MQILFFVLLGVGLSTMVYVLPFPFILKFILVMGILGIVILLLINQRKPEEIPTLEVNRQIAPNEYLAGEIMYETPNNYLVKFTTFADGQWEELIPKDSSEITSIYKVTLLPMRPSPNRF